MTTSVVTKLHTDEQSGQLVEAEFEVRAVAGPDRGKVWGLEPGTTLIGSNPAHAITLTDPSVSRTHLEVRLLRDRLEVRDVGSTNGTRLAGARVQTVALTQTTRLGLGKETELEFVIRHAAVTLAPWPDDRFGEMLGRAPTMRALFATAARVATTDATLLIEGETGSGKEALAEAVHRHSPRDGRPFVVVDCGAIPRELIGAELFGHVRGAFTGAVGDKAGLIEAAHTGTVFLDEIGELALDLQPQLLRVLDRRQVRRIGGSTTTDVDVRVIAATHRDLRAMVKAGTFREDLYYRLAVVRTTVPPLRDRPGDLELLAEAFARGLGRDLRPSDTLLAQLRAHQWPGNVRELRNVVERALTLGDHHAGLDLDAGPAEAAPMRPSSARLDAADPSAGELADLPFKEAKAALVEAFERDYVISMLAKHKGNVSRAAADAGIDRNYIHRLVKKYGLTVDRG